MAATDLVSLLDHAVPGSSTPLNGYVARPATAGPGPASWSSTRRSASTT
ncbi:MAG: hypothetical protein H0V59_04565 [Nocardioidaceae bacterium]|nr:hypothetical protein [Nocardioidaceae bacterium]